MKPEIQVSKNRNKPFRPGIWLNEIDVEFVLDHVPAGGWFRAELMEKFSEAKAEAERKTAAYAAGCDL